MNKFIVLPFETIRDNNTTDKEKYIFAEIYNLSQSEKGCIAQNNHFANMIGSTPKSVSNIISSLVKKGYIKTELVKGSRNHLRKISILKCIKGYPPIMDPYPQKLEEVSTNNGESKGNNTVNKKSNKKESEYELFLSKLKDRVKIKSKVTKTKEGEELFKSIKDKDKLMNAYIKHQKENDKFAQRITVFMLDYDESVKVNKVKRYV